MTNSRFAQLKADIGGPWLADLGAFGLMIPLWFVWSILGLADFLSWPNFAYLVVANAVALALCMALLLLFRVTIFRSRATTPVPVLIVGLAGILMGAMKSVTTSAVFWIISPEDVLGGTVLSRVIPAAFTGLWLLPLGAVILATRERYQEERNVLIAERVLQRATLLGADARSNEPDLSAAMRSELQAFVAKTRTALDDDTQNRTVLARQIHAIIRDQLRPLSHRIWRVENSRHTDFSLPDLLRLTIIQRNFATLWILTIYAVEAFPLILTIVGIQAGLSRLALELVLIGVSLEIGRRLPVRRNAMAAFVFFGSIIGGVVLSDVAANMLLGPFGEFNSLSLDAINILTISTTALIIGAGRTAYQSHERIRQALVETMTEDQLLGAYEKSQRRIRNRDFAQFLHGRVQAQMLETALRLEATGSNHDVSRIREELDVIDDVLSRGMPSAISPTEESLSTSLGKISGSWTGLIDVAVSPVPDELPLTARQVQQLTGVVHEAVGNAVRHGFATEVRISCAIDAHNVLLLTVHDNGTGPRRGKPGLGSALYDSIALGTWSLNASEDGSGSELTLSMEMGDK
jgi:signal transduction histidine kinase